MPTVSVITPTHDRADVISEAIASVQHQTFDDFEHVIVDDGSTDATPEIVQAWMDRDDRIRYRRLEQQQGHAAAQNRGLEAAEGDYIAVLDSDDLYRPDRLDATVSAMRDADENVAGVVHPYLAKHATHRYVHETATGTIDFDGLAERNVIAGMSNTLFRRSVAEDIGGFDEQMASTVDYDFQLRIAQDHDIVGLEEVLTVHRFDVSGVQDDAWRKRQGLIRLLAKHHEDLTARNTADRLMRVGRACLRLERTEEALTCFERAERVCPEDKRGELTRDIGISYLLAGHSAQARSALMDRLKTDPTSVRAIAGFVASFARDGRGAYDRFRRWYRTGQSVYQRLPTEHGYGRSRLRMPNIALEE